MVVLPGLFLVMATWYLGGRWRLGGVVAGVALDVWLWRGIGRQTTHAFETLRRAAETGALEDWLAADVVSWTNARHCTVRPRRNGRFAIQMRRRRAFLYLRSYAGVIVKDVAPETLERLRGTVDGWIADAHRGDSASAAGTVAEVRV